MAVTLQPEWVNTIYRAHKTLNEMLRDRGYVIADDMIELSRDQIHDKLQGHVAKDATAPCMVLQNQYSKKNANAVAEMDIDQMVNNPE